MSLFTLILWSILGFLIGVLMFIVIPVFAPSFARYRIAQWYFGLSAAAYRRMVCLITKRNTASIIRAVWEGERQTEQIQVDGNDNDFQDPRGSTLRCKHRPFAFALSDVNKVVHPRDAEIAKAMQDVVDEHGLFKTFAYQQQVRADGGQAESQTVSVDAGLGHVILDAEPQAVDMQYARKVDTESHEPNDTDRQEEDIKKSQEGFASLPAVEAILLLVACLGGTGSAWFIYSNTGGGGSSPVTIPVSVMPYLADVMGVVV